MNILSEAVDKDTHFSIAALASIATDPDALLNAASATFIHILSISAEMENECLAGVFSNCVDILTGGNTSS